MMRSRKQADDSALLHGDHPKPVVLYFVASLPRWSLFYKSGLHGGDRGKLRLSSPVGDLLHGTPRSGGAVGLLSRKRAVIGSTANQEPLVFFAEADKVPFPRKLGTIEDKVKLPGSKIF